MYSLFDNHLATIVNSTFEYNTGTSGNIRAVASSKIVMVDCNVRHNRGETGGGLYILDSQGVVNSTTFYNNSAITTGGAIYLNEPTKMLIFHSIKISVYLLYNFFMIHLFFETRRYHCGKSSTRSEWYIHA